MTSPRTLLPTSFILRVLVVLLFAGSAQASDIWTGDFSTGNVQQYGDLLCGAYTSSAQNVSALCPGSYQNNQVPTSSITSSQMCPNNSADPYGCRFLIVSPGTTGEPPATPASSSKTMRFVVAHMPSNQNDGSYDSSCQTQGGWSPQNCAQSSGDRAPGASPSRGQVVVTGQRWIWGGDHRNMLVYPQDNATNAVKPTAPWNPVSNPNPTPASVTGYYTEGDERWFGMSAYVPADTETSCGGSVCTFPNPSGPWSNTNPDWHILWQVHSVGSCDIGGPMLSLGIDRVDTANTPNPPGWENGSSSYMFTLNKRDNYSTVEGRLGGLNHYAAYDSTDQPNLNGDYRLWPRWIQDSTPYTQGTTALTKGHWHTFVIHVKFSVDPSVGLVQAWSDGAQVYPATGDSTNRRTLYQYGPTSQCPGYTAWANGIPYGAGAIVANHGNLYQVSVPGTSAATGTGPSGTGIIADGTVTWAYVEAVPTEDTTWFLPNSPIPEYVSYGMYRSRWTTNPQAVYLADIKDGALATDCPSIDPLGGSNCPLYTITQIVSGPAVSNVTSTSATITWQTNLAANSQVTYGVVNGGNYQTPVTDTNPTVTNHSVTLSGLSPYTEYFFSAVSSGVTAGAAFTTLINAGAAPPLAFTPMRQDGTIGADIAYAVAADLTGNVYVAGSTTGAFPGFTSAGSTDIFVGKYNPNGALVWLKQMGSAGADIAQGIAVDNTNSVIYIAGDTTGSLPGNTNAGGKDVFVYKLNMTDGSQSWSSPLQFGSSSDDSAWGATVDGNGNVILAGSTLGSMPGSSTTGGAFASKYNSAGVRQWVTQFGAAWEVATAIAVVGSTGDVGISGYANTGNAGFLLHGYKVSSTGSLDWTGATPGWAANSYGAGVAIDSSGNVYVAGGITDYETFSNAALVKYDGSSGAIVGTPMGTGSYTGHNDWPQALSIDSGGALLMAGYTLGSFFGTIAGGDDAFVAKYTWNASTNAFNSPTWGTQFGTSANDMVNAVVVDASGAVIVAGQSDGVLGVSNAGSTDLFVAKYVGPTPPTPKTPMTTQPNVWTSLQDSFGGTSINSSLWSATSGDGNGTNTESNGVLTQAVAASDVRSVLVAQSNSKYSLIESKAAVRVSSVVSSGGGVDTIWYLMLDWNNTLAWWYERGNLFAEAIVGGNVIALATLTYDPVKQAWWRFSETNGVVYFETSAEGKNWTQQASMLAQYLFPLGSLQVVFAAREYGSGNSNPGLAEWSKFNIVQ